jgi:hypothetical protein
LAGFVNPTALVPGAWEDLFDCLPEAERAVGDHELADRKPASLQVEEESLPGWRTFANAVDQSDESPSCPRSWRQ